MALPAYRLSCRIRSHGIDYEAPREEPSAALARGGAMSVPSRSIEGRGAAPLGGTVTAALIIVIPLALATHLLRRAARHHRTVAHRARRAAVRAAARADGDGHADLDRARPFGADLSVHPFRCRSEDGRLEAVHQHRPLRDHGDSVLHPGRQFSHYRRRGAPHDRFRHFADRSLVWRAGAGRRRRLRVVRRDLRLVGSDRRRHRLDHVAGAAGEAAIRRVSAPA